MNCERYSYRVKWSKDDQEYVALCAEFPSLSFLASKPAKAIEGIVDLVAGVVSDLQNAGEIIPRPLSAGGSFRVQVTHKRGRLLRRKRVCPAKNTQKAYF